MKTSKRKKIPFVDSFFGDAILDRKKKDLRFLFENAPIHGSFGDRVIWINDLLNRMKPNHFQYGSARATRRLLFVLHLLDTQPTWKAASAQIIQSILRETTALELFSDTGLPSEQGFLKELTERAVQLVLPKSTNEKDLAQIIKKLFPDVKDFYWVKSFDPKTLEYLNDWMMHGTKKSINPWSNLYESLVDALLILSAYIASNGLSRDIRVRASSIPLRNSPFIKLHKNCEAFCDQLTLYSQKKNPEVKKEIQKLASECRQELQNCRKVIQAIFKHLEEFGISVDLVYRLEKMEAHLKRIENILIFLSPNSPIKPEQVHYFLNELILGGLKDQSFQWLIKTNLKILSRKIIERAGQTGEHYITYTKAEYFTMLWQSAGGGALTAITAFLKFFITSLKLSLFFEATFSWLNYSGSFLIMNWLHFKLATKQPSMTAAALASRIYEVKNTYEFNDLITTISRITRSQLAAAVGNIGMVIPAAWFINFIYQRAFHKPILGIHLAHYVVDSLHPLLSMTVPFAALTGAVLWISSLISGWIENWSVYRGVHTVIARNNTLIRFLGKNKTQALSQSYAKNISGIGSSISLGFLLANIPILGKFLGLPLDVRHVTLSTGALTLAVCSLVHNKVFHFREIIAPVIGIILIGMLNFGISFLLSLGVIIRGKGLNRVWVKNLIHAILKRFLSSPMEFIFPVKQKK